MSAGVTMPEMISLCLDEAFRIETTQANLVGAGLRAAPDAGQLRRMRVFEAIIHVIDMVRADQVILNRLREKARVPKPAAGDKKGSEASSGVAGDGTQ
jgi:hypothetical protein